MKRRRPPGKQLDTPPTNPHDGATRMIAFARKIYGEEARPHELAGAFLVALFSLIDRTGDPAEYRKLLDDAAQAAYDRQIERE